MTLTLVKNGVPYSFCKSFLTQEDAEEYVSKLKNLNKRYIIQEAVTDGGVLFDLYLELIN